MTFLKLLLNSSIIYITIIAIATPIANEESKIKGVETDEESKIAMPSVLNNKSSNISDYMFPIHYNIKIMLGTDYLHSVCIITLNISYAKRYIRFYVPDATFIVFSNLTLNQNNDTVYEANHTNIIKNNIVVLDFGDVSFHGIYDLYIEYIISINIVRESFGTPYINENEEIEWLIATGVQRRNRYQTKKQQMLPYWDKPKLRITFIISIIHHPKYKVWSNMPIRDIELTDDNMTWTFFNATPLISIDRVAFLVSSFRHIIFSNNETIRSSISYRPQSEPYLKFAKTFISSINVYMHTWNIRNKKLAPLTSVSFENKIDHVVIPDLQNEIEQTFGFIFYREADITYNEELDPVAYKTIIARLIARGMIQKYIRNLFRPTYLWPNTWLNDGFNIFYSVLIIDKALPNSRMIDLFVVQIQHELL
ncbi:glutamyl aminopeptidase-like [Camponotus floridanus]|uniref:glutamyl aminopeptidase-like n=1 Tax=Camponotus floridanus TaxID=104421 RepID=UPI000DC6A370|nr:glutamyl aminopeptidase-like [Camponotus floridanus]